jgi:ligand-binding SRPBCC domain-containing protein
MEQLMQEQLLPISLKEAWDFFSTPRNLDQITPADLAFEITNCPEGKMYEGAIITYRIGLAPLVNVSWVTEIKSVDEGRSFVDEQRFGPYKFWHHRHSFEETPGGVIMRDHVHWALPVEPLTWPIKTWFVRPKVESIFRHRREILADYFSKE